MMLGSEAAGSLSKVALTPVVFSSQSYNVARSKPLKRQLGREPREECLRADQPLSV
jgi:hypothetical protein